MGFGHIWPRTQSLGQGYPLNQGKMLTLGFRKLGSGPPQISTLPKGEQSTGPRGHATRVMSTWDPRIPCPMAPKCTSRACMGLLTGSVLSIDRTTDVCPCLGCGLDSSVVWCSVEGACAAEVHMHTVKVLLEYDRAGGGKRRGFRAHRLTLPHSCQNSGQTVRSLNVNLSFQVASNPSLSR